MAGPDSESSAWPPQVHQAIGMILAQAEVDTNKALLLLVDHAKANGRTVQEMAVEVLERRLRFDDPKKTQ